MKISYTTYVCGPDDYAIATLATDEILDHALARIDTHDLEVEARITYDLKVCGRDNINGKKDIPIYAQMNTICFKVNGILFRIEEQLEIQSGDRYYSLGPDASGNMYCHVSLAVLLSKMQPKSLSFMSSISEKEDKLKGFLRAKGEEAMRIDELFY